MLKWPIVCDLDRATRSGGCGSAFLAERTPSAGRGVEFDGLAEHEGFGLSGGTGDRARAHIEDEIALSESRPVARDPWLTEHFAPDCRDHAGQCALDIAAIDGELANRAIRSVLDIRLEAGQDFRLRPIRRRNSAGEN